MPESINQSHSISESISPASPIAGHTLKSYNYSTPIIEESLEEQMLDALELFQYSFIFKDSLFVILLSNPDSLAKLLTDIQLIQNAQIFLMILVPQSKELDREVAILRESGLPLEYICHDSKLPLSKNKLGRIRKEFNSHDIVITSLKHPQGDDQEEHHIEDAIHIANLCTARKLFYIHRDGALFEGSKPLFHISLKNLASLTALPEQTNISSKILRLFVEDVRTSKREIAILDDEPGALFQEIFTHQGRGTLITDEYPNNIRFGERKDSFMVGRLIKPYAQRGILLPIPEEVLQQCISDFLLYTINDAIVAGARMKKYGSWAELASFFCLPRFRRRGHARMLALEFLRIAKEKNLTHVFSLSVSEGMWFFLESIGFHPTDRNTLPDEWKKSYNMNRASKAYILEL